MELIAPAVPGDDQLTSECGPGVKLQRSGDGDGMDIGVLTGRDSTKMSAG